ncbi:MAG: hypothetical protein MJZ72_09945 [Bacteroidales bacterium]|nr:hypothetical protein [Bacteroidales bacterium]
MIVVSDTTPLISFLKINRLDILEQVFGQVLVPQAVYNELTVNNDFPDEIEKIKNATFLKCVVVDHEQVALIQEQTGLDLGESEAIAYAQNSNTDVLLMDELKGRLVAKTFGIKLVGTIGILMESLRKGYTQKNEVQEYVRVFRESHRRISERLLEQLLEYSENF